MLLGAALLAAAVGCGRHETSSSANDREVAARIRQSLVADAALSSSAKNVTIDADEDSVTLRGSVASEQERATVAREPSWPRATAASTTSSWSPAADDDDDNDNDNSNGGSTMKTSVYCIATTEGQADRIVRELQDGRVLERRHLGPVPGYAGIAGPGPMRSTRRRRKAPRRVRPPAVIVGGALGWLAGIGTLAIPGVGPFIAAGPILAALGGAAVGATVGGLTGGLVGLGIPEYEVKRYEGKLASGNILISVHCGAREEARRVKEIFERAGAEDISDSGESNPPHEDTRAHV
jgi:hypothetical protein